MNNITNLIKLQGITIEKYEEAKNCLYISTKPTEQVCPNCKQKTKYVHGYRIQTIKDLPIMYNTLILKLRKRRYKCYKCNKTFFEKYSFLPKYRHFTNRLYLGIIERLSSGVRTYKDIAKEFNVSSNTVIRCLQNVTDNVPSKLPECIGIDEFKGNTNGERFQCSIVDLEHKRPIDILPNRNKSYIMDYFKRYNNRKEVKYIVMDMTNNYREIACIFPKAKVIVDKFHYVRQVYWALNNVRKRIQKEFNKEKRIYFKNSKKLIFAEKEKLGTENKIALDVMLMQNEELYEAWQLKEWFNDFRKAKDRDKAKKELEYWIEAAKESKIEEFKPAIKAFINWKEEILNSFEYSYSNGYTEGKNNKIKVIKRLAYGYRNFYNFRKRILMQH